VVNYNRSTNHSWYTWVESEKGAFTRQLIGSFNVRTINNIVANCTDLLTHGPELSGSGSTATGARAKEP
jgi:hypothetical protein